MQDSLHVFREEGQLRCEYVNHGREMKSNRENFAHYWGVVVFMLVFGAGLLAGRSIASSQPDDSRFAARAIQGGMAEVKLGRLAQDLGGSDAVKAFGKRMVEDHSKADDTLQEIASREKMTLPGDITRQEQANLDRLGKLSGRSFDPEYARLMVRDHQADAVDFQAETQNGKNEYIKQFAAQALPTIQEHLQQAKSLTPAS